MSTTAQAHAADVRGACQAWLSAYEGRAAFRRSRERVRLAEYNALPWYQRLVVAPPHDNDDESHRAAADFDRRARVLAILILAEHAIGAVTLSSRDAALIWGKPVP